MSVRKLFRIPEGYKISKISFGDADTSGDMSWGKDRVSQSEN